MVIAMAEFLGFVSPHGSAVLVAVVAEAPPAWWFYEIVSHVLSHNWLVVNGCHFLFSH